MKKIFKESTNKVAAVLIALSVATILTACNGGDEEDDIVGSNNSTTTTSTPSSNSATNTTTTNTSSTPTQNSSAPNPSPSAGSLGKVAWNNNCQSCHGGSTSKGSNAGKTMQAIQQNTGGMGVLNGRVSADDANNIAAYAANPSAY